MKLQSVWFLRPQHRLYFPLLSISCAFLVLHFGISLIFCFILMNPTLKKLFPWFQCNRPSYIQARINTKIKHERVKKTFQCSLISVPVISGMWLQCVFRLHLYIYIYIYNIYIYKWVKRNKEISLLRQLVSLMLFKSTKFFYRL